MSEKRGGLSTPTRVGQPDGPGEEGEEEEGEEGGMVMEMVNGHETAAEDSRGRAAQRELRARRRWK